MPYETEPRNIHKMERIHVSQPWMGLIATGRKTVEGKKGAFAEWSRLVGAEVVFYDDIECKKKVTAVRWYPSLAEYLAAEWKLAAPHAESIEDAAAKYASVINPRDGSVVFAAETVAARGGICGLVLE